MKVYIAGNNRDFEGYNLETTCATASRAVALLWEWGLVEAATEANESLDTRGLSGQVESRLARFILGELEEVALLDEDQSTIGWLRVAEVLA